MQIKTLDDVFRHQIQDLYSAEQQITEALPVLIDKVSSQSLKSAMTTHLEETRGHIMKLEKVAQELDISLDAAECEGMEGLIMEGEKLLENDSSPALDAAIIASLQRVEHYEIAGYGCMITYAQQLEYEDAVSLLKQNMADEERADKQLSTIAETEVNMAAEATDQNPVATSQF